METINEIPILLRREIEARMVAPFLDAFAQEIGWEKTRMIAKKVITDIATREGQGMAKAVGGNTLGHLARALPAFEKGGALSMELREGSAECIRVDITECKYAQMYERLGLRELGALLSCERDGSLFSGFSDSIEFTRTETIMDGGSRCDFCLKSKKG